MGYIEETDRNKRTVHTRSTNRRNYDEKCDEIRL
jgi:hypothetical protein